MKSLYAKSPLAGQNTYSIPVSDAIAYAVLSGTAYDITVPAGANHAVFSGTADFWVDMTTTAAIPGSSAGPTGTVELNPVVRQVTPGDTVSVISEAATVSVAFYS